MAAFHKMPPKEAVEHELSLRQMPLKRLGTPEEVANVIIFLASDLASFVTSSVSGSGRRNDPQYYLRIPAWIPLSSSYCSAVGRRDRVKKGSTGLARKIGSVFGFLAPRARARHYPLNACRGN